VNRGLGWDIIVSKTFIIIIKIVNVTTFGETSRVHALRLWFSVLFIYYYKFYH